jgi:homoserine dehydrogenase
MKIAIAGLGTVGSGLIKLLEDNAAEIKSRAGVQFQIVGVSSRTKRDIPNWTANPLDLVKTDAEVIVELIGGETDALELAKAALKAKKHFVTANKAMLAHHGAELAELAEANGVHLKYEAAVAGGIPVIKSLREGLAGNKITKVAGILNGTCNYILTQMEARKEEFPAILQEAQAKGYAEADPSFDVGGIDASHKLCILASNAFGVKPNFKALYIEGIEKITVADIEFAKKLGYKIKHLCIATESVQRAHPCLIPLTHSLAHVNDVFNAVEIEGNQVGRVMMTGRGAGAGPTASAVASDLVDVANNRRTHVFTVPYAQLKELKGSSINDITSEYYLRLDVKDQPGVLEDITHALREGEISVHKFLQEDVVNGAAQVIIITHAVKESVLRKAVEKLAKLASVNQQPQVIRILS